MCALAIISTLLISFHIIAYLLSTFSISYYWEKHVNNIPYHATVLQGLQMKAPGCLPQVVPNCSFHHRLLRLLKVLFGFSAAPSQLSAGIPLSQLLPYNWQMPSGEKWCLQQAHLSVLPCSPGSWPLRSAACIDLRWLQIRFISLRIYRVFLVDFDRKVSWQQASLPLLEVEILFQRIFIS